MLVVCAIFFSFLDTCFENYILPQGWVKEVGTWHSKTDQCKGLEWSHGTIAIVWCNPTTCVNGHQMHFNEWFLFVANLSFFRTLEKRTWEKLFFQPKEKCHSRILLV
jgi:hypothetical protein